MNPLQPVLEIMRGKAEFPQRLIDQSPFFIGAGNTCQLQLSAAGIPMVAAQITVDQTGCQLTCFHRFPQLRLNGQVVKQARLAVGDLIELGPYAFYYGLKDVPISVPIDCYYSAQTAENHGVTVPPLPEKIEELSAEELVDRITRELELLSECGHFDDPIIDFDEEQSRRSA